MHMRTTLILDADLIERARELTGISQQTALVRAGLQALIAREAGKRLAALGGSNPRMARIRRRRPPGRQRVKESVSSKAWSRKCCT
jgi:hypothetical protein